MRRASIGSISGKYMKKTPKAKEKKMCEPTKEAKFEHKVVKEARKLGKEAMAKKDKNYGK